MEKGKRQAAERDKEQSWREKENALQLCQYETRHKFTFARMNIFWLALKSGMICLNPWIEVLMLLLCIVLREGWRAGGGREEGCLIWIPVKEDSQWANMTWDETYKIFIRMISQYVRGSPLISVRSGWQEPNKMLQIKEEAERFHISLLMLWCSCLRHVRNCLENSHIS